MNQIYFTADLHFGHPNIVKHSIKRPFSDPKDIAWHDEWLLQLWKETVYKRFYPFKNVYRRRIT